MNNIKADLSGTSFENDDKKPLTGRMIDISFDESDQD